MAKYFFVWVLVFFNLSVYSQSIKINELMSSNSNVIQDPDFNNYSDWIELYNTSDSTVNLKNFYISDNANKPTKFKIESDCYIEANSYLLIWADDQNTGIHTNFKLSGDGEFIGLYNKNKELIDGFDFPAISSNKSYGRETDGAANFITFDISTPGTSNSNPVLQQLPAPEFSLESGFYTGLQRITLTCTDSLASIFYTTDGNDPNIFGTKYSTPLTLSKTKVVKCISTRKNYIASPTATSTYFINENIDLPVVSLSTNIDNFWSDTSGIYVIGTNGVIGYCSEIPCNWNQDWERPITIELFEKNKTRAFCEDAGVKIFGNCSRLYSPKSLAFFFRPTYGNSKLNYQLFPDNQLFEYNNFILRNSGEDLINTMIKDGFIATIARQNTDIGCQAFRPTIVFFDGQYWGIHNLREKLNEHYIEEHYGIEEENLDLIENYTTANYGDLTNYNELISFVETNDLSLNNNYDYLESNIDIDEYIDYMIFEVYCGNSDWPYNNVKVWRAKDKSTKWRWLMYDMDYSFGARDNCAYNVNTLSIATGKVISGFINPDYSTVLFSNILKNEGFKNKFIQRFASRINNTFDSGYLINVIDSLQGLIANQMPRHKTVWSDLQVLLADWEGHIQIMRDFATYRPNYMRDFIKEEFNINGIYSLSINTNHSEMGTVLVQGVQSKDSVDQILFDNIPVTISAVPKRGYKFVKWRGASSSHSKTITLTLTDNDTLTAVFATIDGTETNIAINEINFNSSSSFDSGDWVELYNLGTDEVNLSGWRLTNLQNDEFSFPPNSIISGKSYLVICQDTSKFISVFNRTHKVIGNFLFELDNIEDKIVIYNNINDPMDEVHYNFNDGWDSPPEPGVTLSLINPAEDNSIADNWGFSTNNGTPGFINENFSFVDIEVKPTSFEVFQNYPNPFNPNTTIKFSIPLEGNVTLKIYNLLGQLVLENELGYKDSGMYAVNVNMSGFTSGIYIYCVSLKDLNNHTTIKTNKMVLLK